MGINVNPKYGGRGLDVLSTSLGIVKACYYLDSFFNFSRQLLKNFQTDVHPLELLLQYTIVCMPIC